jgi:hypothetical protein
MAVVTIQALLAGLETSPQVPVESREVAILRSLVPEERLSEADTWVTDNGRFKGWPEPPKNHKPALRPNRLVAPAVKWGDAYYVVPAAKLR